MEFDAGQLTYLDALGIDVWVHRDHLLAQQQNVMPEPLQGKQTTLESVAVPASQGSPAQATGSGFMAQASEALKSVVAPAVTPNLAVNSAEVEEASAPASYQEAPRFNLQFWCYSTGLWFVSCHNELLPEHHKFVHNLAQYLQGKRRRPRHVGIFSWPMIDSPNIDQGVDVAKKYLQQHMEQIQQLSPCSKLIALDAAAQWLPPEGLVSLDLDLANCLSRRDEKQRIWKILLEHQIS